MRNSETLKTAVWSLTKGLPYTLMMVAGIVAFVFSTIRLFENIDDPAVKLKQSELTEINSKLEKQQAELEDLRNKLSNLNSETENFIQKSENADIAVLGSEVEKLTKRFNVLRESLGGDIERSLSVAMLRKDMESSKQSIQISVNEHARSIDRVYDQNKWFLGLLASFGLGIIGLLIPVFKNRNQNES